MAVRHALFLLLTWWAPRRGLAFSILDGGYLERRRRRVSLHAQQTSSSSVVQDTTTAYTPPATTTRCSSSVVKTVLVCTGHLCCATEDNETAHDIWNALEENKAKLQSSDTSDTIVVEESVCLGQCGLHAVVAVDYQDGGSRLCFGLDEVMQELGLEKDKENDSSNISNNKGDKQVASPPQDTITQGASDIVAAEENAIESSPTGVVQSSSIIVIEDPRDRMRASAAKQQSDRINPWMNAAGLLVKTMLGQK